MTKIFELKIENDLDAGSLRIIYYKYKAFIMPLIVITVSIILVGLIIIPQVQNLFTLKDEEAMHKEKLAILQKNIAILSQVSDETLDKDLQVVSAALPPEKDFFGVLTALSESADGAGVTLQDFSLQIGEIATPYAPAQKNLTIKINLNVSGKDVASTQLFMKKLNEKLPLSEVRTLESSRGTATMEVLFYYKPFTPVNYKEDKPIKPVLPEGTKILETMRSWQSSTQSVLPQGEIPSSSSSGSIF